MATPTPDEITAALAVLRRMPGLCDNDTLGAYARANTPHRRMATDLLAWWNSPRSSAHDLEQELADSAARHGLRITTDPDPGELIQYRLVRAAANGWLLQDPGTSYEPSAGGLSAARADRATFDNPFAVTPKLAALYLVPEGGQR